MKKWITISTIAGVAIGGVIYAQLQWTDNIERQSTEAAELVREQHNGNIAIGSSTPKFAQTYDAGGNIIDIATGGIVDPITGDIKDPVTGETIVTAAERESGSATSIGRTTDAQDEDGVTANAGNTGDSSGDSATSDGSADGSNSTTGTAGSNNGSSNSGSNSGSSGSGSSNSGLSQQQIIDTYARQFQQLQSQEMGRVNNLVTEAQSELAQVRSGNSNKSSSELQLEYVGKVQALEASADTRFNEIQGQLKSALQENGHSTAPADEIKAVYEAEKESRRLEAVNQLFSQ
ncbi:hypothetical protein FLK61_39050 [Paenalkalicoccus suaedae]|uniref:Uncharacterized protein n=1 Tax=Paenalkalicoccus suaedae TaxID=2592382 RepID=A0A859FJ94_9BACI|nr:hypothetical protein [Paenalkalicoccus suaedae]QKS72615.1 hypothetical protein FLK61_39050 [Paenalkalicoccus suaedae]